MRVLLVNDWVAHPGGVERYLLSLREGLRGRGDDVKLLTSSTGSAAGGSADYVALGARRRLAQIAMQVVNPFAVAQARRAVREFRPDVALVSMFEMHLSPAVLAALHPTPTVLNVGYYKPICPTGLKLWPDGTLCTVPAGLVCWRRSGCLSLPHWLRDQARYGLIGRELSRVAAILTCSAWMKEVLTVSGVGSEHLDWPVQAPPATWRRAPARDPVFVYVGRLSPEKGLPLLFEAFARLRGRVQSARLRVVGDGPERAALEASAPQGVTFTGRLEPAGVDEQLIDAWALVAPSLWAEPFGLVAAEAIVRAVPVIASATGGFAETVEAGVSGWLFPNGDVHALGRCLERVATTPDFAVPADVIARIRARHDPAQHVDRLRGLFARVAA